MLTGCGFKLRGAVKVPSSLTAIYLTPDNPYEPFQRSLRRALLKKGITIYNTKATKNTVPSLVLSPSLVTNQILAYGPNGLPQRYKISLAVDYQLLDANNQLLTQATISKARNFTTNTNAMLASNHERDKILQELQLEAICDLLQQLVIYNDK